MDLQQELRLTSEHFARIAANLERQGEHVPGSGGGARLLLRAADHIAQLERVTACLLDHYLNCYEGNKDFLALEAENLVPDWQKLMQEWKPTWGSDR